MNCVDSLGQYLERWTSYLNDMIQWYSDDALEKNDNPQVSLATAVIPPQNPLPKHDEKEECTESASDAATATPESDNNPLESRATDLDLLPLSSSKFSQRFNKNYYNILYVDLNI